MIGFFITSNILIITILIISVLSDYRNAKNILENIGCYENIRKINNGGLSVKDAEKMNKEYINLFYGNRYNNADYIFLRGFEVDFIRRIIRHKKFGN